MNHAFHTLSVEYAQLHARCLQLKKERDDLDNRLAVIKASQDEMSEAIRQLRPQRRTVATP